MQDQYQNVEAAVAADTAATAYDVVRNWQWIMALGIINIVGGLVCLITPATASLVAEAIIAFTVLLVGVANLTGVCYADDFLKGYYLVLGGIQFVLGLLMWKNPFGTLATLTFIIGIAILLDGSYQVLLCYQNRGMKGWGLVLASGLASVVLGIIVLTGLPEASIYVIGLMWGINLLTMGNLRVHLAWEGRSVANE